MKSGWTVGVTDKERIKDIEANYKSSSIIRKRLVEYLEAKIFKSMSDSRCKTRYNVDNWALDQADSRGYERALQDIIALLVDKKE